jgi:hypothetical protein
MEQDHGRVPDGTGLSQAEPQSAQGLGPSGFDPSRDDAFWGPEIVVNGIVPAWLARQEPFVWVRTYRWLEHFRLPLSYEPPFSADTSQWCWKHSDGHPCIRAIRLPADHPAYSRDSDGSGEAGETAKTGSTVGDSAGPKGIAQPEQPK